MEQFHFRSVNSEMYMFLHISITYYATSTACLSFLLLSFLIFLVSHFLLYVETHGHCPVSDPPLPVPASAITCPALTWYGVSLRSMRSLCSPPPAPARLQFQRSSIFLVTLVRHFSALFLKNKSVLWTQCWPPVHFNENCLHRTLQQASWFASWACTPLKERNSVSLQALQSDAAKCVEPTDILLQQDLQQHLPTMIEAKIQPLPRTITRTTLLRFSNRSRAC